MIQIKQAKIYINEKDEINKYNLVNRLIEVTHNVDYLGNIKVEKTEIDQTDEELIAKKQRI